MGVDRAGVVLIGLRRSGKSRVAPLLAAELGLPWVDLDHEVARQAGTSLPELVAQVGWPGFRRLEKAAVAAVTQGTPRVVACGGGTPMGRANRRRLRRFGWVLYLRLDPTDLVRRLIDDSDDRARPPLTSLDPMQEVIRTFAARDPVYRGFADAVLDAGGTVEDVVSRCLEAGSRRAAR